MKNNIKFVVEFKDNIQETMANIFNHLITYEIKDDKPCVIAIVGKSGRGKSSVALHITDKIFELNGINLEDYVTNIVINDIRDFGPKVRALLKEPHLKKPFALIIDEAKKTINSKDWNTLINQTVDMINSQSRAIKPMAIFILSQRWKDIDSTIRDSIDYYIPVSRPRGKPAKIRVYEIFEDDKDVEKPKMRKKTIKGQIKEGSSYNTVYLKEVEFPRVRKEVWEKYKKEMIDAKLEDLEHRFDALTKAVEEKYYSKENARVTELTDYLVGNRELLFRYGHCTKKNKIWKLNKEAEQVLDLTPKQKKDLEVNLTNTLKGDEENDE